MMTDLVCRCPKVIKNILLEHIVIDKTGRSAGKLGAVGQILHVLAVVDRYTLASFYSKLAKVEHVLCNVNDD